MNTKNKTANGNVQYVRYDVESNDLIFTDADNARVRSITAPDIPSIPEAQDIKDMSSGILLAHLQTSIQYVALLNEELEARDIEA